jgi:hypothetical protein
MRARNGGGHFAASGGLCVFMRYDPRFIPPQHAILQNNPMQSKFTVQNQCSDFDHFWHVGDRRKGICGIGHRKLPQRVTIFIDEQSKNS